MEVFLPSSPTFRFASFHVDLKRREVYRQGIRVELQEKPFRLLEALILARGQVVTRDELTQALWPGGRHVAAEMGIHTAARKLRRALGDSARQPGFVETVPRVGYRLLPPVTRVAEADCEVRSKLTPSRGRRWISWAAAACLSLVVLAGAWRTRWEGSALDDPIAGSVATFQRPLPGAEPVRRQYLAALHLKLRGTAEASERAAELFAEVTRLEPDFDPAYGDYALALVHRALRQGEDCQRCEGLAREAVSQALDRSPDLAEALLADGLLALHYDWDWARVDLAFRRAEEVAPDNGEVHLILAMWQAINARHNEALRHVRRAVELDPGSFLVRADAGFFYLAADRDQDAAAECRLALTVDPSFIPARRCLLLASQRLGAFEEAARQARLLMLAGNAADQDLSAFDSARDRERLQTFWKWRARRLDEMSPASSPVSHAAVLIHLDQQQAALAWLEKGYSSHHPEIVYLNLFAEFKSLRELPGFRSLLNRLELPMATANV